MINQNKEDHYVYVLVDSNNCFRYIGQGRGGRVKNTTQRSSEFKEILKQGRLCLLHNSLTKEQAIRLENYYLTKHIRTQSEQWNLINKVKARDVAEIHPSIFVEHLKVDENSESGLVWLKDAIDSNGKRVTNRIGKSAGTKDVNAGYYKLMLNGIQYKNHRVVWSLANNKPICKNMVVNHIDSNGFNNKIENLEITSYSGNSKVAKRKPTSTTVAGVTKSKSGNVEYFRGSVVDSKNVRHSKSFSISKYGYEEAFRLACEWRKQMEELHCNT